MRISEIFNLNKSQPELDFVDVDTELDTPLFLDPFFLGLRTDRWSLSASDTIRSFFQQVIRAIREENIQAGKDLFGYLHEPNATCLGLSEGKPRGRGVGLENTDDIFESIVNSRAIQSGVITDLEDNLLFVNGFGKDKLSDMTTNIIRKHLLEYTVCQCKLHNITLTENIPSGYYWNGETLQWEQSYEESLIVDGKQILLVPKGIISYSRSYVPDKYYNHYVLNFMQSEHLRLNSTLVQRRVNGTRYVTKKDLKEKNPLSKEFLIGFTNRNPEVLKKFKDEVQVNSLSNLELTNIDINRLLTSLSAQLRQTPAGAENAGNYHTLILGILDLLFYPHLIYPKKENEIHDGRKRIDITFDNGAKEGIFHRLHNSMRLPCSYIMVECKNYSSDPVNPELDQLSGRFSPNRGVVGFLVCRDINNFNLFLQRCQDTYRDNRGLIIPVIDEDILSLLNNYDPMNFQYMDRFLSERIRQIAIN